MTSEIDNIIIKVLNDRAIFNSPQNIPILFNENKWKELENTFEKNNKIEFNKLIDDSIMDAEKKFNDNIRGIQGEKKNELIQKFTKLKTIGNWLKNAFDQKPYILKQLFNDLSWYGLVRYNLPGMDDFGSIIESYDESTVKHFFYDKIKKNKNYYSRKGLEKVLEYVTEFYELNAPVEQIAYFVRKLKSLTKYWEVIE